MARKCSICNSEGHNTRTCNVRDPAEVSGHENVSGDEQLGPQLDSTSGNDLSEDASSSQPQESSLMDADRPSSSGNNNSEQAKINKAVRWSREEHLGFVKGLEILGKGRWKAMSCDFVPTRTPNQISSHAQKYFKRIMNPLKRKRNPSIFDAGKDDHSNNHHCLSCKLRLCPAGHPHHHLPQPDGRLHHQTRWPPSQSESKTRQMQETLDLLSNFVGSGDERHDQQDTEKDEEEKSDKEEERLSS